jgi:hypothetical protein
MNENQFRVDDCKGMSYFRLRSKQAGRKSPQGIFFEVVHQVGDPPGSGKGKGPFNQIDPSIMPCPLTNPTQPDFVHPADALGVPGFDRSGRGAVE